MYLWYYENIGCWLNTFDFNARRADFRVEINVRLLLWSVKGWHTFFIKETRKWGHAIIKTNIIYNKHLMTKNIYIYIQSYSKQQAGLGQQ
jgi:hypothetical protein